MAAGERNKKGKATDIVKHFFITGKPIAFCGNKKAGYITYYLEDVTCLNCIKRINKIFKNKPDGN